MIFNKEITGYENEEEFATYLNGKQVGRVYPNFLELLNKLYGYLDYKDYIECWVNKSKRKADIYIKINGYVRGISIKKGVKNSVHVESIGTLVSFFRKLGIGEDVIKKFLYYQYADGTINGTGKTRISSSLYREKYQKDIDEINKVLNDEKYINAFVNRFVLQGNKSEYEVDAIIYGVVEDFIFITKEEVYYIMRKHLKDDISSLHVSLLTLQPMARNLNYNPKYEACRNQVQVKWYNISDNIIEVMAFYRNRRCFSSKITTGDNKKELSCC
ncbi:MAG TPA: hypothetical protein IAB38_04485 [Candidatus Onthousia excrementipullorum]|uniref:Uncharacterized protein n=1 Tax=Candidatus Onthousia excrementipullorum TaxID=2840884 RepID=A0A9D1J3C9_9FIRM|nr:hypothetical protein [Candidatus Onthousia excrementipullorum]